MRTSVLSLMSLDGHAYAEDLERLGVEVGSLGLRTRWDPTVAGRAAAWVGARRPDLLHTHLKHADVVGSRVSRRLGIPFVSTLHMVESSVGPLGRVKRRAAFRARAGHAARTVAVSDAVRAWYLGSCPADPSTVITIHNGVAVDETDPAAASSVRAEFGVGADRLLAVTAAIMRPGKGHDVILEAAASLPEAVPVTFAFVGEGPEQEALLQRAHQLGLLGDRVLFPGFRSDIGRVLAAADLAVQASLNDALPTSLLFALAAGVPIVATRVGGIPEIVGAEAGILIEPGDARALADAVDRLCDDPAARRLMGKRGRERFEEEFDGRVWIRRLRGLYDEVLGRAPPSR